MLPSDTKLLGFISPMNDTLRSKIGPVIEKFWKFYIKFDFRFNKM